MTDDLVSWLRERLDEDERLATATGYVDAADPYADRLLAEVQAKRAILDLHAILWRDIGWLEDDEGERVEASDEIPVCGWCVPKHSGFQSREAVPEGACKTVRLLAAVFSDRPGYQENWRP